MLNNLCHLFRRIVKNIVVVDVVSVVAVVVGRGGGC